LKQITFECPQGMGVGDGYHPGKQKRQIISYQIIKSNHAHDLLSNYIQQFRNVYSNLSGELAFEKF